jgi:hypothetical protein
MNGRVRSIAEWGAAAVGAALAGGLLVGWAVPGGSAPPPASVTLVTERSQDLDLRPAGDTLGRALLSPASPALTRAVTARNATAGALVVRLRAVPREAALDGALAIRIRTGGATVFAGRLWKLRKRGSRAFTIPSHATARVVVRTWLPAGALGYEARVETVPLQFVTEAA